MITVDLDLRGGTFKVGSPLFESLHDGQKLFIVDSVVEFRRGQLPTVVRHRVHRFVTLLLGQDAPHGKIGGVGLNVVFLTGIKVGELGAVVKAFFS